MQQKAEIGLWKLDRKNWNNKVPFGSLCDTIGRRRVPGNWLKWAHLWNSKTRGRSMWVDHLQARPSSFESAAVWVLSKQGTPTYQSVKNKIKKAGLRCWIGCSGQHIHIFSITLESEKDIDKLQEIRYMRMYRKRDHAPKLQEGAQWMGCRRLSIKDPPVERTFSALHALCMWQSS